MSRATAQQRLELGAKRYKYRWRLREVMDANAVPSMAALGRMLGSFWGCGCPHGEQ